MEPQKRKHAKTASVRVKPYLAEYAAAKYPRDPDNGGLLIPPADDLYHCLWHNMARPRKDSVRPADPNLTFSLPCPRPTGGGAAWKDPARYNHIPIGKMVEVERCLQRQFDFELHRSLFENMESGRPRRQVDVVYDFIRQYRLKSVTEEALLKNFHRYRSLIRSKKPRRYTTPQSRNPSGKIHLQTAITSQNRI